MKQHHYKYSNEHLDFVKVKRSISKFLKKATFYIVTFCLIVISYYVVYAYFFDTPAERGLRRENEMLTTQYEALDSKFDQVKVVLTDLNEQDKKIYYTIFQTESLNSSTYNLANWYEELSQYMNVELVQGTDKKLQRLEQQVSRQSQSLNYILQRLKEQEDSLLYIPAIQPVYNPGLEKTGASVGMRIHPFYKILKMHNGIDFVAAIGTKVVATASGKVKEVGNSPRDRGLFAIIDHENGYETMYAHLDAILVKKGEAVKRGTLIGRVGNTGASLAPHLHYEILKDNTIVDPVNYFFVDLSPAEYTKMIHLASNNGQSLD